MDQQAMRITLAAGPNSELESFALRAALEKIRRESRYALDWKTK